MRRASGRVLIALALLGTLVVAVAVAQRGEPPQDEPTPSSTLPNRPATLQAALLASPHRLAVVYWPALRGCTVCDVMLIEKLEAWQEDPVIGRGLTVVTAVPTAFTDSSIGSTQLPGEVVRLPSAEYRPAAALAPVPRLEVWRGDGQLLLLRSIPSYTSQLALLDEELLAARWFTAPLVEVTDDPDGAGADE